MKISQCPSIFISQITVEQKKNSPLIEQQMSVNQNNSFERLEEIDCIREWWWANSAQTYAKYAKIKAKKMMTDELTKRDTKVSNVVFSWFCFYIYLVMFLYGICVSCESLIAAFGILFESINKTIKAHIYTNILNWREFFLLAFINKRLDEQ